MNKNEPIGSIGLANTAEVQAAGRQARSFGEFVGLMALMISLVALSIDAVLPALAEIGQELGVQRENDNQLIISLLFLGMAAGQMIYGPLSDSTGRKPAIYAGFGLFMGGSLLALLAPSFPLLLAGRVLQGIGAAGPRIVTVALIRDQYEGRAMARVMSFVMAVFILVPVIAPLLGQTILLVAHWRAIFGLYLGLALIASLWFALRQPETLTPGQRIPFSLTRIGQAIREVVSNRPALGYTLTLGTVFGAFIGYLNSSQQLFQNQYGLGQLFPLYFAILALAIGSASFLNARLVMRYGMRWLSRTALLTLAGLSLLFWLLAYAWAGQPPLWALMVYFLISFFCIGLLFGNLNALAMEPLGHIAGIGAAVVGSLSTFISLMLGTLIGQSYNGTVLPLIAGFALLSLAALGVMHWVEARRL
ncbi:MAG: Bcr/CflA family drug resistance efflux transporter [Anaerolineae bacterium]|nr:multidrug effflux MFS transporter [Anaerolineales bacterium]MCQ3973572.1 Bcr/CflA family drug resistance efflux transporter [Anaerolineae bacterium]